ncbi:hypothetical protein [Herbiconiux sp.]|jgi:hypothetical protein|uniref:hypothetical protein n=1 Tax=Herbiconiux sp. TaxID=1871186 RepID=UPI0025BFA41B|nr:hypothetical protein [Herbiconiux sp.]
MPPRLTARQLFITGIVLTAAGATLALITDGWLTLIFTSADLPFAIAGTIATLVREITMTLGLVLIGVSTLSRVIHERERD